MNVRNAIDEIHDRVERRTHNSSATGLYSSPDELTSFRAAYERMYHSRDLVGTAPPSPDTLRARLGGHLVRFVQRMLFWYTPQIRRFQNEATSALGSVFKLMEHQLESIAHLQKEIAILRSVIAENRMAAPTEINGVSAALPFDFEYALQDRFRGSEEVTRSKLAHWLQRIILAVRSGTENGVWLDFGCGRGEWLELVKAAGYRGEGVDSNPFSIAQCRAMGLDVEQGDGIEYLRSRPERSLEAITAFHVVEHLPADRLLELLRLAHGKLRAGGVLAIETPNAANLSMGAHRFWNDPTHQRPVTAEFLEFALQYAGFTIADRADLNPSPGHEHLPYTEIELVNRVDRHLYGPQDYGLIGRRNS